jgi:very-short-patch-repair endonuclease
LERKWRFDFAWPAQKVALEVDGGIWIKGRHNQGAAMKGQWEKENEANCAGWHILKCEPKETITMQTVNLLKRALKV